MHKYIYHYGYKYLERGYVSNITSIIEVMDASKEKNKFMKNKEKELEQIKNPGAFEKKKKKKKLIIIVVLIILIIFALLFSVMFAIVHKGKNTIAKGVSARGIELSNLTYDDAKNTLITALNKETETPIKLKYEDYYLDINLSEIEFKYDIDATLNEAYQIGRDNNIIKSKKRIKKILIKKIYYQI